MWSKGIEVSLLVPPLIGYMILAMTKFTTAVILVEYIQGFNITNAEAGSLFSIFVAFYSVTTFFGGGLSYRTGRPP